MASRNKDQEPERKNSIDPSERGDAGKMREYLEGDIRSGDRERPYSFVGRVPPEFEDMLIACKAAYEKYGDGRFEDTEFYRDWVTVAMSKEAGHAVRNDDLVTMQSFVGEPQSTEDVSGIQTTRRLRDGLRRPAYVCYIHGHMGNGKTDFALLLAELWKDETEARGDDAVIAANIESFEEKDEYISDFDEYVEWLEETDKEKMFIFDEASSHASGYASQAQQSRKLGRLVNLIRKYNGNIVIIGHTGKDVHPDIRRKCIHFVRKTGTKTNEIRTRNDIGEGEGDFDLEMQLEGIPQTSFTYDHKEASSWDWGEDNEKLQAYRMKEIHGIPVESKKDAVPDLTELYDVSKPTLYDWFDQLDEEDKEEVVASVS
jgi:hypothetical protein